MEHVPGIRRALHTIGFLPEVELTAGEGRLRLRLRLNLLLPVIAIVAIQLIMLRVFHAPSELAWGWLGLCLLGGAINIGWLVWWSVVEFDQVNDLVRRGPRTIGRMSDIEAIAHPTGLGTNFGLQPALQVVFARSGRMPRHWTIPRVPPRQAVRLGRELAAALGVPFR
jgi:hypothetical protein